MEGGAAIKTELDCPCGEALKASTEDALVELAHAHLLEAHQGMSYTREEILFLAR